MRLWILMFSCYNQILVFQVCCQTSAFVDAYAANKSRIQPLAAMTGPFYHHNHTDQNQTSANKSGALKNNLFIVINSTTTSPDCNISAVGFLALQQNNSNARLTFGVPAYRGTVAEIAPRGTRINIQPEEIHARFNMNDLGDQNASDVEIRYRIAKNCSSFREESDGKNATANCSENLADIDSRNGTLFLSTQAPAADVFASRGKQPKFDVTIEASALNECITATIVVHVWLQQPLWKERLHKLSTPPHTVAYKIAEFPAGNDVSLNHTGNSSTVHSVSLSEHHAQKLLDARSFTSKLLMNQQPKLIRHRNSTVGVRGFERPTGHPYFLASTSGRQHLIVPSASSLGEHWSPDWRMTVFSQPRVQNLSFNHVARTFKHIREKHTDLDPMNSMGVDLELAARGANVSNLFPVTRQPRRESYVDNDSDAIIVAGNEMEMSSLKNGHFRQGANKTFSSVPTNTSFPPTATTTASTSEKSEITSSWSWLFNIADARTALAISLTVFACILLIIVGILSATLTRAGRKRRVVRPFNQRPSAIQDLHSSSHPRHSILSTSTDPAIRTSAVLPPPPQSLVLELQTLPPVIPASSSPVPPVSTVYTSSNATKSPLSSVDAVRTNRSQEISTESTRDTVPKVVATAETASNVDTFKTAYCRAAAERRQNSRVQPQRFVLNAATIIRRRQQERARQLNWFGGGGTSSAIVSPLASNKLPRSSIVLNSNKERVVLPVIATGVKPSAAYRKSF